MTQQQTVEISLTGEDYAPLLAARDANIRDLQVKVNALIRGTLERDKLIALQAKEINELKATQQAVKECDCNGYGTDHSKIPELEAS